MPRVEIIQNVYLYSLLLIESLPEVGHHFRPSLLFLAACSWVRDFASAALRYVCFLLKGGFFYQFFHRRY